MYKHILVATDGSDLSTKAVRGGVRLAKSLGAHLTAMTVVTTPSPQKIEGIEVGPSRAEREKSAMRDGSQILEDASVEAQKMGVSYEGVTVVNRVPYEAIIDTAKARGCDLIVMASHGRSGLKALLLGSVAQKVVTHSPIHVLVHR
jgi:nucleotide-binding universal stress UspA family protein